MKETADVKTVEGAAAGTSLHKAGQHLVPQKLLGWPQTCLLGCYWVAHRFLPVGLQLHDNVPTEVGNLSW